MEEWPTGKVERAGALVRRVLAPNPSAFTFTGTQTYIIGQGEVAVIDPGPAIDSHIGSLMSALGDEQVTAILCTHTHRDHSPASRALRERTGAPIVGCAALVIEDEGARSDEAFDPDYRPDRVLGEGDTVSGPGWTLEAVATPGHTSNHLCFALRETRALFSGDHVMGWSTTVVAPPDGDMAAYMASLDKLLTRDDRIYYPAHGPPIAPPRPHLEALIAHRREREKQVLAQLEAGQGRISAMVARMYAGLDPRLHGAAERSVLAHLLDLEARGLAARRAGQWGLPA
jgi:glyoxylase-like metal-dependent hydrolase (beta-lactamase superfamily II)